jgi:hypothetical protein
MNIHKIKHNWFYGGLFILFIILVLAKQCSIAAKNNRQIENTYTYWQSEGKPVVVVIAEKKDLDVYKKITLTRVDESLYKGYATGARKENLKLHQKIYVVVNNEKIFGEVVKISNDLDIYTGLYAFEVTFDKKIESQKESLVAYINIETKKNVIALPHEAIDIEGNDYSVWKVAAGRAVKQTVEVNDSNGYGYIIKEGVDSKDKVIIRGQSLLFEGERVNVISDGEVKK